MRIAAVSFLNTWPLIEGLAAEDRITVETALPSALPRMLRDDLADVALMPVYAYLQGEGAALVPGVGIGSAGRVDSVKLFARRDPGELSELLADRGSRTSVALLDVLLRERWSATPAMVGGEPRPETLDDIEAFLAIGDRCFEMERAVRGAPLGTWRSWDLGELWSSATDLPFVYAAWTLGHAFVRRSSAADRARLVRILRRALERGRANLSTIVERAHAAGKLGVGGDAEPAAIAYYLGNSLRFDLDDAGFEGLSLFRDRCVSHGLLRESRPLEVVDDTGQLTRNE